MTGDDCTPSAGWLLLRVQERIDCWTRVLKAQGIRSFRLDVCGALRTGHYSGPKPRAHSLNPGCPRRYGAVAEVDVRLILPAGSDPHAPTTIALVERVTGTTAAEKKFVTRWHRRIPITYLYAYEDLVGGIGLEWELCLNREPYLETSAYWALVFSAEEVAWQARVRQIVRQSVVPYREGLEPLKEAQAAEARWRICASHALDRWQRVGPCNDQPSIAPPLGGPPPPIVALLVEEWLRGEARRVPPARPADPVSALVAALGADPRSIPPAPDPPDWVGAAVALQEQRRRSLRVDDS